MNKKEALVQVRRDLSWDNVDAQFFIDTDKKELEELDLERKKEIQDGKR